MTLATAKQEIEIYFGSREFRNRNNQQAQDKAKIVWNALESQHRDTRGLKDKTPLASSLVVKWCWLERDEWLRKFSQLVSVLEA